MTGLDIAEGKSAYHRPPFERTLWGDQRAPRHIDRDSRTRASFLKAAGFIVVSRLPERSWRRHAPCQSDCRHRPAPIAEQVSDAMAKA
jgi:hypothetical protein